jgi:hypothetical protein
MGHADPSMQLEMEIRGMRADIGPADEVNRNGTRNETETLLKDDIEMS